MLSRLSYYKSPGNHEIRPFKARFPYYPTICGEVVWRYHLGRCYDLLNDAKLQHTIVHILIHIVCGRVWSSIHGVVSFASYTKAWYGIVEYNFTCSTDSNQRSMTFPYMLREFLTCQTYVVIYRASTLTKLDDFVCQPFIEMPFRQCMIVFSKKHKSSIWAWNNSRRAGAYS